MKPILKIRPVVAAVAGFALLGTPALADDRGFAARDDAAQLATNGFLDRRADVAADLFGAYWRDVHGPLAARIDGMHQYWQHHLAAPAPDLLPDVIADSGVAVAVSDADRLEGLAEVTFVSEADRAGLGASPAAGQLMDDEQNIFQGTYLHATTAGNTRTLVDHARTGAPQGARDAQHVILLLAATEDGDRGRFRALVTDGVAAPLATAPDVVKVRYHLFEAYDASGWDTPNVDNDRTQAQAFDAWIELGFTDGAAVEAALASVGDALADPGLIAAVHAYPVGETYTLVYDGRPTLAGLRGYAIMETVTAVGAANQRTLPVLRSLHGDAVEMPGDAPSQP